MGNNYLLPNNIQFSKSKRQFKKYKVEFDLNGEKHVIHFGDNRYQHYKDRTPLKAYSFFDHNDKERRRRYYLRHGTTINPLSAKYWSSLYLW